MHARNVFHGNLDNAASQCAFVLSRGEITFPMSEVDSLYKKKRFSGISRSSCHSYRMGTKIRQNSMHGGILCAMVVPIYSVVSIQRVSSVLLIPICIFSPFSLLEEMKPTLTGPIQNQNRARS